MSQPFISGTPALIDQSFDVPHYGTTSLHIAVPNFCEFEQVSSYFKKIWIGKLETVELHNLPYEKTASHFPVFYQCQSCHQFICFDYVLIDERVGTTRVTSYDYNFSSAHFPFDKVIEKVSPGFKKIYLQAQQAERLGLNELDLMGYRKALEFLVKDFLIKYQHEKSESIGSLKLSKCISKLKTPDLTGGDDLALISSWIGNDGTHYAKRNPEYTLEDAKNYLRATVSFITYRIRSIMAHEAVKQSK